MTSLTTAARSRSQPMPTRASPRAARYMQELSKGGKAIYGFNRGVGQNKDVTIDEDFMETQNRMMLRSHSLGLPPFNTDEEVRAMMVIRLNNMLIGASCASDDLANSYRDFLNHGITPRIPRRGAVGEADITTITHIGLAFIGEEDVNYKGKVVSAKEAMEKEGLKPLHLQLKDTHTIMLSNSQGEGTAAILVHEVESLVKMSDRIFCLDYEGLNGNIEPMREDVNELRGLPGQIRCAARCREDLEGSYLYSDNRPEHALQDPLTFRGGFIITGAVEDALDYVQEVPEHPDQLPLGQPLHHARQEGRLRQLELRDDVARHRRRDAGYRAGAPVPRGQLPSDPHVHARVHTPAALPCSAQRQRPRL